MKFKGISYAIIANKRSRVLIDGVIVTGEHDIWYGNSREACIDDMADWVEHHGLTIVVTGDVYAPDDD